MIAIDEFLIFCLKIKIKKKKNNVKFVIYDIGFFKKKFVKIPIIDADIIYVIDCCLDALIFKS
jgi:hypothetical protein